MGNTERQNPEPGESQAKDRDRFDRDSAGRWVAVSAIHSIHQPDYAECIAALGADGHRQVLAWSANRDATSSLKSSMTLASSGSSSMETATSGADHGILLRLRPRAFLQTF
jgi:hypothetical protein